MNQFRLLVMGVYMLMPVGIALAQIVPVPDQPTFVPAPAFPPASIRPLDGGRPPWEMDPFPPGKMFQLTLQRQLTDFGHRNWIVIADSAYPAQNNPGIQTISMNMEQAEMVQALLETLSKAKHVRPQIYLDAELPYVPEKHAAGIEKYRADLKKLLGDHKATSLPHEKIIEKLDAAGDNFKVLILKSNMTLPYTSVFIELNCGYWSDEAEQALRAAMPK